MSEFWLAAAAMCAAALAFALPAFLRPRAPAEDDSRRENIAAARRRLRELQERDLPKNESDEYEEEIKIRLLEDAGELSAADGGDSAKPPAADKTGAALACALLLPGALALYWHLGAPSAPPPMPDFDKAIAGLRLHIAENPDDAEALALMGRTLATLGREEEAAEFFARALAAQTAAENAAPEAEAIKKTP